MTLTVRRPERERGGTREEENGEELEGEEVEIEMDEGVVFSRGLFKSPTCPHHTFVFQSGPLLHSKVGISNLYTEIHKNM